MRNGDIACSEAGVPFDGNNDLAVTSKEYAYGKK
jgi:hypothetical protein